GAMELDITGGGADRVDERAVAQKLLHRHRDDLGVGHDLITAFGAVGQVVERERQRLGDGVQSGGEQQPRNVKQFIQGDRTTVDFGLRQFTEHVAVNRVVGALLDGFGQIGPQLLRGGLGSGFLNGMAHDVVLPSQKHLHLLDGVVQDVLDEHDLWEASGELFDKVAVAAVNKLVQFSLAYRPDTL